MFADNGEPLHPAKVSRRFTTLSRRPGCRVIRLHSVRHTSASLGPGRGRTPAPGQPTARPLLHRGHRGRLLAQVDAEDRQGLGNHPAQLHHRHLKGRPCDTTSETSLNRGLINIQTLLSRITKAAKRLWRAHQDKLRTSPVYETLLLALLDLILGRRVDIHQLIIQMMSRLRRNTQEFPDPDGWAY